jgi:hypothetical protein
VFRVIDHPRITSQHKLAAPKPQHLATHIPDASPYTDENHQGQGRCESQAWATQFSP